MSLEATVRISIRRQSCRAAISVAAFSMLVLIAGLPAPTRAGSEALFVGLVPGEAVSDEELSKVYGKGGIDIFIDGSSIFGPQDTTLTSNEISTIAESAFTGASGIMQIAQFNGDNNVVVMDVNLTININSVLLTDSSGNTISNLPTFDLSGSVQGIGDVFSNP